FDPRPAVQWKNDPQAQRHVTNREFSGKNPQGGTAINVWAKADVGAGKLEVLQNNQVVGTMDVNIKAGMNRFQWAMRGLPAAAGNAGGAGGGRGGRSRGGAGAANAGATNADATPPAGANTPPAPNAAAPAAAAPEAGGAPGAGGGGGGGG